MTEKQTKSGIKELSKNEVNNLVEKALANESVQTLINNSLNHYPAIKAKYTDLRALITQSLGGEFTKGTTPCTSSYFSYGRTSDSNYFYCRKRRI